MMHILKCINRLSTRCFHLTAELCTEYGLIVGVLE
jgi:hypothetical protein